MSALPSLRICRILASLPRRLLFVCYVPLCCAASCTMACALASTSHVYRLEGLNAFNTCDLVAVSETLVVLVPCIPSHCEQLFQLCVSNLTNLRREVSFCVSLSLYLSLPHAHTRTNAHIYAQTHIHTRTHAHKYTHRHTHAFILSEAHFRSRCP